ncbi:hypothetical protein AU196_11855 [Mycobacterium sp. IS-1742]|nr:hypothetical protein AU196_11855 [Mycobacterium sp. IS-1742]
MNRAPEGGLSYELTSGGCSTATTQERSLADPSPSSWFTNIRRCEAAERPASLWNHFTSEIEAASDRFHGFLHHVLRKLRFFFHWHHGHGGGGNNGQNGNNGDNGDNGNNGNQSLAFVVS